MIRRSSTPRTWLVSTRALLMLAIVFLLSIAVAGCAAPTETPTPDVSAEPVVEEEPTETPVPPSPTPTAEPTETPTFTPAPTDTPEPTDTAAPDDEGGFCGDRICAANESEQSCAVDCAASYPASCEGTSCGDGVCQPTCGEDGESCPSDCGDGSDSQAAPPEETDEPVEAAPAPSNTPLPTDTVAAPPPAGAGTVPLIVVNQGCEKQGVVIDGTALYTVDAGDTITIQVEIGGHTVQNCGGTNCSGEMWVEFEPPGVRFTIVPGDYCQ